MQGLNFEDLLSSQVTGDDGQPYFTAHCVNPQGQLRLSLNRPLVFATTVGDVLSLGPTYGRPRRSMLSGAGNSASLSPVQQNHILLIHNFTRHLSCGILDRHQAETILSSSQRVCACDDARRDEATLPTGPLLLLDELDLNEGRALLVLGLLLNLLKLGDHSVFHYSNIPQVSQILHGN